MPRYSKALLVLVLSAIAVPASAQVGIFSRVKFGAAFLDASSNCTALTVPTGSFCTDTDDGTVWSKTPGGWVQITGGGGGGTVTSVGLALPSIFAVSGSPVTTAGTLTGAFVAQSANRVLASPDGSPGVLSARALVLGDIPSITTAKLTDGTILFADWDLNGCVEGESPTIVSGVWDCATPSGSGGAPVGAQYLTLALDATLTNERVPVGTANQIVLTDGGAGGNLTFSTPQNIHTGASPTFAGLTLTSTITFPDGVRQTFNPNATNAGINVGSQAGDPSAPSNGDLWYDSSANELTARINGSNVALGSGGGGSGTVTHTGGALTSNRIVLGAGSDDVTILGSLGTTTTVLHGNAAAPPTFGAVDLTADVSGDLPFANLAQGSALSVLGVTGNATADNASIAAGSDHQVLRRSGTAVAFGAVNLAQSAAVTGDLPFANITQLAADSLAGRGNGGGTGDIEAITLGTNLSMSGTTLNASGGGSGKPWIQFTALQGAPPASNPATFNTRNATPVLEFDTTTQEATVFVGVVPDSYAGGGLTVSVHWAAASATTGTIGWDVAFERIGDGSQDLDADGFATAQTITATTVPGTSGLVDITNVLCTDGANIDSLAAGEAFRLRVRRDVSNDTATGDAQLVVVTVAEP